MDCDLARELSSARVDGELVAASAPRLDAHLASCAGCTAWVEAVHGLKRVTALRRTAPPADLAQRVIASTPVPDMGVGEWIRYALGVVAAGLVVLNLPLLLATGGPHADRHLGAFGAALGAGLLWAAVRPERAIGLVPLAAALAAAMAIAATVDMVNGNASAGAEAAHVLEASGLALLWLLSGGRRRLADHLRGFRGSSLEPV